MPSESDLRRAVARHGKSLYDRRYAHGSSGNISVRLPDAVLPGGMLITPTNSCMGDLDPDRISKVAADGTVVSGDPPSKEAFLHLAMYAARPMAGAVVHLHCTHAVCVSCLDDLDPACVLPPITAYYAMRIGRMPLVPYFRPGDKALAAAVGALAADHHAVLLANHGPVVAGKTLDDAVYNAEELEETAKLYLMMEGRKTRWLTTGQIDDLARHFPS
ncbi:class II aldolase [Allostella vacuolata]|nr:class II aldolase [Stella vacuolata]